MSLSLIRKIIREELGRNKHTKFSPDSPAGIVTKDKILEDYIIIDITSNTADGRISLTIAFKEHLSNLEKKNLSKILPVKMYFNSYNEAVNHKNLILQKVQQEISKTK